MTQETPPDDRIELWGRRIGRTLAIVATVVLAVLFIINLRGGW